MVVSAEKARQKAEARRQRILAKSAERMDVVNGLAPKNDENETVTTSDNDANATTAAMVENESNDDKEVAAVVENDNIPSAGGGGSKGARRMAAMRKRRYQAKKKEEEEEANDANNDEEVEDEKEEEDVGQEVDATEPDEKKDEPNLLVEENAQDKQQQEQPSQPQEEEEESSAQEPKKKYMGVARMRRKIIKEQKAQRIAELEASATDAIDAAATIATIGMTASMIRDGSSFSGVDGGDLSEVTIQTLKKNKKKWWKLLFPPMSLVPRLVTLVLLFMAGLDVGLEPHRTSNTATLANNDGGGGGGGRGGHLIYHVESSFTKPWEYGMGGKARHMMGMKEAAPPTAMPTSFSFRGEEGVCLGTNGNYEVCETSSLSASKEKEREVKEKLLMSENGNDDEFANNEEISRPKGVSTSEFDDDDEEGKETYSPPVIDPIFQVDLDALLQNSQLPAPVNFAAKFAIGFHRMWVRYLWTVPTSVLKSILYSPKTLVSSWMANPPVFLFISLLIRVICKVLVGKTPSFSEQKEDENDAGGKKSDNLDVMAKVKDMASNYFTSKFPKTILVLKTLKEVVTVDMYVILCGLLVGLVSPLVRQDLGFGVSIGGGKVLGDGEL